MVLLRPDRLGSAVCRCRSWDLSCLDSQSATTTDGASSNSMRSKSSCVCRLEPTFSHDGSIRAQFTEKTERMARGQNNRFIHALKLDEESSNSGSASIRWGICHITNYATSPAC
eukprot:3554861-Amphidinium_carterae.1